MKKLLMVLMSVATLLSVQAQNVPQTPPLPPQKADASKSEAGSYEFTIGGSGVNVDGDKEFGFDFSISTNPFKTAPNLWFGLNQGFAWEPKFSGSTDVNVNWSWHLLGQLWLNTGWSVGTVYDTETSAIWRTGPEATFEYYVGDSAFIYSGVNYDIVQKGENGFRYSFGVGLAF